MNIAIVGHGPSMKDSGLGDNIDSYDFVIRQKAVSFDLVNHLSQDFGKKTNAVCGSYTIREALLWHNDAQVWVFVDSRHHNIEIKPDNRFIILKEVCANWNDTYRSLRTDNFKKNSKMTTYATSSDLGHNHMSCGLHTIIYACEILKPKNLTLFGFDNIKTGEFTWSLTRGEGWDQYPDHRWDTENQMISLIQNKYSVGFHFI